MNLKIMINIILSLYFFIAAIGGFTTSFIILFSKKSYPKSFFLGLFLFSIGFISVYNFYVSANAFKNFPAFLEFAKAFIFLIAPSSFLYVRGILFPDMIFKNYDWLHFSPFIFYFSLTIILSANNYDTYGLINDISDKIKSPFSMLSLTVWLAYAVYQTMIILNYNLKQFSNSQFYKLNVFSWIRFFNLMILCLFSTLFVYYLLVSNIESVDFLFYTLISLVLFFTVALLYFKPQIFYDNSFEVFDLLRSNSEFKKTTECKTPLELIKELNPEKKEIYLMKLNNVLYNSKLFLKKDFVIRDLSDATGISVHQLSSLINSEFGLHFQDFVNLKRIEYFNQKINDPEWKDLSLEGMAWGSGFKSRTTCFRAFVKHTGKSPSEYTKEIRKNSDKILFFESKL
jgi:AraC-like DNA-binding protein